MDFCTGPNSKYSQASAGAPAIQHRNEVLLSDSLRKPLWLARTSFLLPTPTRILCKQHRQAFPFVFNKPWLLFPSESNFGLPPESVLPNCHSETQNECVCLIQFCFFSQSTQVIHWHGSKKSKSSRKVNNVKSHFHPCPHSPFTFLLVSSYSSFFNPPGVSLCKCTFVSPSSLFMQNTAYYL